MSLDTNIDQLSRVSLFHGFEIEQLRLLAFGAEPHSITAGTTLYKAGSYADGGYVVIRGFIDVTTGSTAEQVRTYGPGSLLGEMALISEIEHAATAKARTDAEVLKIPRLLFRRMLEEYPDLAIMLHARIGRAVTGFVNDLERLRRRIEVTEEVTP